MSVPSRRRLFAVLAVAAVLGSLAIRQTWAYFQPIRLVEVEPGSLYRGAWQQPLPMRNLVDRYQLRSVLALAHPVAHPLPAKERDQIRALGVRWKHIPIIDDPALTDGKPISELLDEAADWLADPQNRPLYFHCHHGLNRTSMVQMAWRLKHCGWTLEQAAQEIERTLGPDAIPRGEDYRRIEHYAAEKLGPRL